MSTPAPPGRPVAETDPQRDEEPGSPEPTGPDSTDGATPAGEPSAAEALTPERPGPGPLVDPVILQSAVLRGACCFVPIPFLDDLLADRAKALMVGRLLGRHGRTLRSRDVKPLWATPGSGCLLGCLGLGFRLILKPLKILLKTIFFVLMLREVALAVGETWLLGRTLDLELRDGRFPDAESAEQRQAQATRVRAAFDEAYAGSDVDLLARIFRMALSHSGLALSSLLGAARRSLTKDAEDADQTPPAVGDEPAVRSAASRLAAAIDPTELATFLRDFDARFKARLAAPEGDASQDEA